MLYAGGQKNRQRAIMSAGSCQLVSVSLNFLDLTACVTYWPRHKQFVLCIKVYIPFCFPEI